MICFHWALTPFLNRLHVWGQAAAVEGLPPVGEDDFRSGGEGQIRCGNLWLHDLSLTTCGPSVQLVSEAIELLNSSKITAVIVVDAGVPVGIVHLHDLLRAGVA